MYIGANFNAFQVLKTDFTIQYFQYRVGTLMKNLAVLVESHFFLRTHALDQLCPTQTAY